MKAFNACIPVMLVVLLITAGCSPYQPIRYNMGDIKETTTGSLRNYTLSIEEFSDARKEYPENDILFTHRMEASLEDGKYCINSEEFYEKDSVSKQITSTFAEHLRKKNIFKSVTLNNKENTDFYLTGKVQKYYGIQEYSYKKAIGNSFGLVGVLLTYGIKTEGRMEIIISDLSIRDRDNKLIANMDDIHDTYDGELIADSTCWAIYWYLNAQLKVAFENACQNIEKILEPNIVDITYQ